MVNDIIPSKYMSILQIISVNTGKSKINVQKAFLRFFDETQDFQHALIKLHNMYVKEKKEQDAYENMIWLKNVRI